MYKMLTLIMVINSSILPNSSFPLLTGLLIIMQTFYLTLITRMLNSSSWLPMTIFLVMIGGLMVIFLYTTSIASNEMLTKFNFKKYILIMILWLPIKLELVNIFYLDSISILDNFNKEFFKMFSEINFQSTIFMFFYLLLALLIMIKLISLTKGPMRKKY